MEIKLQTLVDISRKEIGLRYNDSILCIGSCFADEIGTRLKQHYFDVVVNPFGVLFNPLSIRNALGLLEGYGINSSGCSFMQSDVIQTVAGYSSFYHHTSFTRASMEEFLSDANEALATASSFYYRQGWVIVTLGTSYVYREKKTDMVVANCHKLPHQQFSRSLLSVDDVFEALASYVGANPKREWIFTVSPIRHISDGMHENQISKATLLLALERLVATYPNAHYFPAYEIVMDELRDYRFYAEDMVHISKQSADYIYGRFIEWALDNSQLELFKRAQSVARMMQHRVMNPNSQDSTNFIAKREHQYRELMESIKRMSE